MRQGAPKGASWGSGHSAVTTQFDADQRLNIAAALKEMARLIQGSVHGCNILERVSETCSLRANEKRKAATAAQEAAGKLPVLSGVVEFTTAEAVLYAKDAQKIGIGGLMVLPGMVCTCDTRETLNHFRTVARAGDLSIMIDNNPRVWRVDSKPETFGELASDKIIVAVKESFDDPRLELAGAERARILGRYETARATRAKLASRPKSAVAWRFFSTHSFLYRRAGSLPTRRSAFFPCRKSRSAA